MNPDRTTATASIESAPAKAFQFTVTGLIEKDSEALYLVCRDERRLRISKLAEPYPTGQLGLWYLIPNTDSTGQIATVNVVNCNSNPADREVEDKCNFVGRVVQLGKRNTSAMFKINRLGEKPLKITLLSPGISAKVGDLVSVTAIRLGDTLQIQRVSNVEKNDENKSNIDVDNLPATSLKNAAIAGAAAKQEAEQKILPNPVAPKLIAQQALTAETGYDDWELSQPEKRWYGWEWEALRRPTGDRARVQIGWQDRQATVYKYPIASPTTEDLELQETDDSDNNATSQIQNTRLIVKPLGAARGIGASCFQIFIGPYEIVLDCGTRPKGYDPLPALDHLNRPNLLLISHAHQDHLGAVPVFHSRYPDVRMICTPGTREIAHVMLQDCLKVQQRNEDSPELFDEDDLSSTLFRLETQPVGKDFEPLPGLQVRFINAGHIVGAACIYLRYGERSLLYTGDYNTASSRTTEGLRLADLPEADMLITESTYGSDTHPGRKNQETALMNAIAEVIGKGGNVLIPAFALGRAQEILLAIRTSAIFHKLKIPVFVDGLVRAVTDVFSDNLELLPSSVRNFVQQSDREPFFDEKSTTPVTPIGSPRERPLAMAKPSVIIASSGMLTGGPSVYYASALLGRENAAIFISGYTDEESPGRLLQNLKTGDTVELDGKEISVRAQVRRFNLSAHADKVGLTQVIHRVNPKHLILIHGSTDALHELARSGDLQKKYYVHIPSVGEAIDFGNVPEHISKTRVAEISLPAEFEVGIEAEVEGAWLRIPAEVVESDPRWELLASNGILRAKWDGFHLKLSPFSQKYIAIEEAIASGADCCAACEYFVYGKCHGEESPLYELKVDPHGLCPEFERKEIYANTQKISELISDFPDEDMYLLE